MRRIVIIFNLVLGLYSCGNQSSLKEGPLKTNTTEKTLFNEFVDGLQFHETPIYINCGLPNNVIAANKFKKYKEFIPTNYDVVFGLIGHTEKFKCIILGQIGDDIYPTLFCS